MQGIQCSDHKIWEIFQNQCLLIDFRVKWELLVVTKDSGDESLSAQKGVGALPSFSLIERHLFTWCCLSVFTVSVTGVEGHGLNWPKPPSWLEVPCSPGVQLQADHLDATHGLVCCPAAQEDACGWGSSPLDWEVEWVKCPLPSSSAQSCRSGQTALDTEVRLVSGNRGVRVQAPRIRRKPGMPPPWYNPCTALLHPTHTHEHTWTHTHTNTGAILSFSGSIVPTPHAPQCRWLAAPDCGRGCFPVMPDPVGLSVHPPTQYGSRRGHCWGWRVSALWIAGPSLFGAPPAPIPQALWVCVGPTTSQHREAETPLLPQLKAWLLMGMGGREPPRMGLKNRDMWLQGGSLLPGLGTRTARGE